MSSSSVDNLKKTIFHAITELKYWELAHEILSIFKLSTEELNNQLSPELAKNIS